LSCFKPAEGEVTTKYGGDKNGISPVKHLRRYSGSFQCIFQIPTAVKGDKVEAIFDKGVLKVTLPKVEEAKKKETKVK
jgi:HSP20 family molecular chaperone IbpA